MKDYECLDLPYIDFSQACTSHIRQGYALQSKILPTHLNVLPMTDYECLDLPYIDFSQACTSQIIRQGYTLQTKILPANLNVLSMKDCECLNPFVNLRLHVVEIESVKRNVTRCPNWDNVLA